MSILMSLDLLAVSPSPHVECFVLWSWDNCVCDWVVKDRNCVFVFAEGWDFLFGTDVPDDSVAVPRSCDKMVRINQIKRADVTVVFYQPNGSAMHIETNDLTVNKTGNREQSFIGRESVDLNTQHVLFDSVAWCLLSQLSVFVPEDVDLLITAASDDEILVLVETT